MKKLFSLSFIFITFTSFSQSAKPTPCLTDSCKKEYLSYIINYGSFPLRCVRIKFRDSKGVKWSEVVYVVSIHNYYEGKDSINKKRYIDSIYNIIYNDDYLLKDTSIDKKFGGYRVNEAMYSQMKSMPFEKFLYKYFDREGNILSQYQKYFAEILSVCFSYNITLLPAEYYYPAIYETTWDDLCKYYPKLKTLPMPIKKRYY